MSESTFFMNRMSKAERFQFIKESQMFGAMNIPDLKSTLLGVFEKLDDKQQVSIIKEYHYPEFADKTIELYAKSKSGEEADWLGVSIIVPMVEHFSAKQIREILNTVKKNIFVQCTQGTPQILATVFDSLNPDIIQKTKPDWLDVIDKLSKKHYPTDEYSYSDLWVKVSQRQQAYQPI
ncbi:MAG: hypothetical protein VSS75_006955 [Candidatus Parabeggiatoa sp.]|nr:hypothetical protein [Candidatus Parabeggiatoa sp.]